MYGISVSRSRDVSFVLYARNRAKGDHVERIRDDGRQRGKRPGSSVLSRALFIGARADTPDNVRILVELEFRENERRADRKSFQPA